MQATESIQVERKVPPYARAAVHPAYVCDVQRVRVPFIFKMNPAIVLFANGISTLLFILITKGKGARVSRLVVRVYRSASIVINSWGYQYALGGFVVVVRAAVCSRSLSISAARTG